MTQNIWTIKGDVNPRDKNLVVFSLSSLAHADVTSILAGSSRSKQRQRTIKANEFSLVLNGKDSKFSPVKAKPQASIPAKPKASASAKRKPAAKGQANGRKGPSTTVSKPVQVQLQRPKGVNRELWRKSNFDQKKALIKKSLPLPSPSASKGRFHPQETDRDSSGLSEFKPNDFSHDSNESWKSILGSYNF